MQIAIISSFNFRLCVLAWYSYTISFNGCFRTDDTSLSSAKIVFLRTAEALVEMRANNCSGGLEENVPWLISPSCFDIEGRQKKKIKSVSVRGKQIAFCVQVLCGG